MSAGRLNTIRGTLIVGAIIALLWGVGWLLFPQQVHESLSKTPFSPAIGALGSYIGGMALAWGIAGLIALRDPLKNLGLLQALIVATAILFLVGLYVALVVNPAEATIQGWITTILLLIVAVVLAAVYPRGQAAS